jgi:hypothetical protein
MSPCTLVDLVNALDGSIATIQRLSELGPLLDEGGADLYFPHAIELFSLIAREAGHLEKLSTSLAHCVLPRPHACEGGQL